MTFLAFPTNPTRYGSSALLTWLIAAEKWVVDLRESVPSDTLVACLWGSRNHDDKARAEVILAMSSLIDTPTSDSAEYLYWTAIALMRKAPSLFGAVEQLTDSTDLIDPIDPAEMLLILIQQISGLVHPSGCDLGKIVDLTFTVTSDWSVRAQVIGPNAYRIEEPVAWGPFVNAVLDRPNTMFYTELPVFLEHLGPFRMPFSIVAIVIDEAALQRGIKMHRSVIYSYSAITFLSDGRIFRAHHGMVFQIQSKQLSGQAAIITIAVDDLEISSGLQACRSNRRARARNRRLSAN